MSIMQTLNSLISEGHWTIYRLCLYPRIWRRLSRRQRAPKEERQFIAPFIRRTTKGVHFSQLLTKLIVMGVFRNVSQMSLVTRVVNR
ncbi:MAG: hypothetical protein GXY44_02185 [Phycisphaerales bacterium]|nr:hypothetical protein [Phycisphaerales bacterium]